MKFTITKLYIARAYFYLAVEFKDLFFRNLFIMESSLKLIMTLKRQKKFRSTITVAKRINVAANI